MDLNYTHTEKAVGLFVIGILMLLLTTVVMIGRGKNWFEQYVPYVTTFQESYGIEPNTPVKLYKTDVGKVKSVNLVGERVEVRLAVQEKYAARITTGTRVTVESPTLIGSEYVSIKPGSISAPSIPPGGVIPSEARRSLEDVLRELKLEETARHLAQMIENAAAITERLEAPEGPLFSTLSHVEATAGSLARISGDLEEGKGTAGRLLQSAELLASIEARLQLVDAVLEPLAEAARQAPPTMDQVQKTLEGLRRIESRVLPAVDQVRELLVRVSALLASLEETLGHIEKASRQAPETARAARDTLHRLSQNMDDIEQIIKAVRQNFLIRPHLPPQPTPEAIDSGIRP
jgi:phospholipid/cholesterol/gamma-HCH transport system substrate-binding protein